MLQAEGVSVATARQRVLAEMSLTLQPGEVHAILGANGAGKSTLLRLLAGELRPTTGRVALDGRDLREWPLPLLARRRAVFTQTSGLDFAFTVAQVTALGRLPWTGESRASQQAAVTAALRTLRLDALADRPYTSLSGGERARVQLARALAQLQPPVRDAAPRYLLLDEPTASLDLAWQHECLRLVRALAAQGHGIGVVLHDPNLALAYADRGSLLQQGELLFSGVAAEALCAERLSVLYGIPIRLVRVPELAHPLAFPIPR